MKIAMVSEHASPLAALGEEDAVGQNVHVAELSAAMTRAGHDVTVYTRRDSRDLPSEVDTPHGYRVVHVPAGPARRVPKDELLPFMGEFGAFLRDRWAADTPDLAHAHFWMSGLATALAASATGVPVAQTFHALGVVKKRYQGDKDTSPADRIRLERIIARQADRVVATCSDEVFELSRLGVPRARMSVVPCWVDLTLFTHDGPCARSAARASTRRSIAGSASGPRSARPPTWAARRRSSPPWSRAHAATARSPARRSRAALTRCSPVPACSVSGTGAGRRRR